MKTERESHYRVRQIVTAGEGYCVTIAYKGGTAEHFPVIAWALIDNDDPETLAKEDVMPVYLDETPIIGMPGSRWFAECQAVVHKTTECTSAEYRALEAIRP